MNDRDRAVWREEHVVDVREAAHALRTYLEHHDTRALLSAAGGGRGAACEVGAGYGRMTIVLTEFFDKVVGFEREPHFVREASALMPEISFVNIATVSQLPAVDDEFALVMTFTVLQHLSDAAVEKAAAEISRVLRPGGHLLICEETDPAHRDGDLEGRGAMCTIGRPIARYQELFRGMRLLETRPRRIEPTYPRPDVGTYMLFIAAPAASGSGT
jgi:SAM-dependent methyltransferase